jgi:hypothetical protein
LQIFLSHQIWGNFLLKWSILWITEWWKLKRRFTCLNFKSIIFPLITRFAKSHQKSIYHELKEIQGFLTSLITHEKGLSWQIIP